MRGATSDPAAFAERAFAVLRRVLGLGLLAAAGLKAHGLVLDPLSQDSLLADPRVQIALIQVEILLGIWLLIGRAAQAARWSAVGFFLVLAAASGYLGLAGQSTCGCLGKVPANPWIMFAVDLAVVAALILSRPANRAASADAGPILLVGRAVAGAMIVLLLCVGGLLLAADDPAALLARLRGERITLTPATADLGEGRPGEVRSFTVTLTNRHDRPVRIIGGTASCQCMAAADLPITLEPGDSETISVRMIYRGSPGRFMHHYELWTDDKERPKVIGRFAGRILPPAE